MIHPIICNHLLHHLQGFLMLFQMGGLKAAGEMVNWRTGEASPGMAI